MDVTTGLATAWNPTSGNVVNILLVNGSTVYAGGSFTTIGGQTRNRIAALDVTTGLATAWNPNASSTVSSIAINGSTVYAGGNFITIGGQTRNRIAALDATTGLATAWNPNPTGTVTAIAVSGSTVYLAGTFTAIGGQTRNFLAALDDVAGLANSWDPNITGSSVTAIGLNGNTITIGGVFTSIGGQSRVNFATFNTNISLPVNLVSFTANTENSMASNAAVRCNWSTATENNSAYFIIERSSNGRSFIPVGQVTAAGNSPDLKSYSYIDNNPLKGISYYRLKQTDRDGRFTYSQVVVVNNSNAATLFTIYPNPAKEEITMAVAMSSKQDGVYSIYDQAGKQCLSGAVSLNKGVNTISLAVRSLRAGIYIIQLKTSAGVKQSQFVKQ